MLTFANLLNNRKILELRLPHAIESIYLCCQHRFRDINIQSHASRINRGALAGLTLESSTLARRSRTTLQPTLRLIRTEYKVSHESQSANYVCRLLQKAEYVLLLFRRERLTKEATNDIGRIRTRK